MVFIPTITWKMISMFAPSEGRTHTPRGDSSHQYRAGIPSQAQHEAQIAKVREHIASGPADNRTAIQKLSDRLTEEEDRQAVQTFTEVTRRWAKEANGSGVTHARLKHAIQIAEAACERLINDDLLREDEAAQRRVLASLRQITEEARSQLREIGANRLVDMSIDLDLIERQMAPHPTQRGS
jgi:hypothetical protein